VTDEAKLPRLTDTPLPPYRHRPGLTPHPTRDPAGHSYGTSECELPDLNCNPWEQCETFLYAIDLFNASYWWECHEELEGLWNAAGHKSPVGRALQAMIQCAAAHLKVATGGNTGAEHLLANAERHVREAAGSNLGIDLQRMLLETTTYVAHPSLGPASMFPADREPPRT